MADGHAGDAGAEERKHRTTSARAVGAACKASEGLKAVRRLSWLSGVRGGPRFRAEGSRLRGSYLMGASEEARFAGWDWGCSGLGLRLLRT